MSLWEYKVITSGRGGFATPALLEKFLNDLGKEEWEIVEFRTQPDNALAFSGLARRTTQRDWTLEDAAAAAARTEADKLRAEFEAKFRGAAGGKEGGAQKAEDGGPEDAAAGKDAATDGLRRLRDTEHDFDPDAPDEEPKDDWDMLTNTDDLPTFFEAIRPHLRRNQRGPGMSAGVDFLAKKWQLSEDEIKSALVECGFAIPEDEDDKPVTIEFEGDLYWLNINRRGELWINTKEKPRPVFRTVQGTRVAGAEAEAGGERTEDGNRKADADERQSEDAGQRTEDGGRKPAGAPRADDGPRASEPLPAGPDLLEKIRPMMRRNRRGPGGSGSTSFLSRGLRCREADLMTAFAALGLVLPAAPSDKPVFVEIDDSVWWLNQDQKGGIWINGRLKSDEPGQDAPESKPSESPAAGEAPREPVAESQTGNVFAAVRLLLKEIKPGSFACETGELARALGREQPALVEALTGAGLKVPEKPREKPVFAEHAGEIFWLNANSKGELWLNAKASKFAKGAEGGKKKKRANAAE